MVRVLLLAWLGAAVAEAPVDGVVLLSRRGWQTQEAHLVESLRIYTRDLNLRLETDLLPHEAASAGEQLRTAEARCGRDVAMVLWFSVQPSGAALNGLRCEGKDLRTMNLEGRGADLVSHAFALRVRALLVPALRAGIAANAVNAASGERERSGKAGPGEDAGRIGTEAGKASSPPAPVEARRVSPVVPLETTSAVKPAERAAAPGPAATAAAASAPSTTAPAAPTSAPSTDPLRQPEPEPVAALAVRAGRASSQPSPPPTSPSQIRESGRWGEIGLAGRGQLSTGAGAQGAGVEGYLGLASTSLAWSLAAGWLSLEARQNSEARLRWSEGFAEVRATYWVAAEAWWVGFGGGIGARLWNLEATDLDSPDAAQRPTRRLWSAAASGHLRLRHLIAGGWWWDVAASGETALPRRRFNGEGANLADTGYLRGALGIGLVLTF